MEATWPWQGDLPLAGRGTESFRLSGEKSCVCVRPRLARRHVMQRLLFATTFEVGIV